jgi:hypothetical protein
LELKELCEERFHVEQSKADTDVKREMQMASLRHDLATAPKLKELVLYELSNGVSAEWIAMKYRHMGASLERVVAFKAALDKQEGLKRERIQSARGNREVSEVG